MQGLFQKTWQGGRMDIKENLGGGGNMKTHVALYEEPHF